MLTFPASAVLVLATGTLLCPALDSLAQSHNSAKSASTETLTPTQIALIADAVYFAEGGAHTRWPYGIKTDGQKSLAKPLVPQEARRVCEATIKNEWSRSESKNKTHEANSEANVLAWIRTTLSKRYCKSDWEVWGRNVSAIYEKREKMSRSIIEQH